MQFHRRHFVPDLVMTVKSAERANSAQILLEPIGSLPRRLSQEKLACPTCLLTLHLT
jgi:hypothetical protein